MNAFEPPSSVPPAPAPLPPTSYAPATTAGGFAPPTIPLASPSDAERSARRKNAKRPKFVALLGVGALVRFGREVLEWVARNEFGLKGVLLVALAAGGVVIGWRLLAGRKAQRQGGVELTKEQLVQQYADSGLPGPAFPSDGTALGTSSMIVNQRTKLIEVNTDYDLWSHDGELLGAFRQIGQSKTKRFFRVVSALDQFFSHSWELSDPQGAVLLRLHRPRKLFYTSVRVYDGADAFVGQIRQRNVFGKVRFSMIDANGNDHGLLHAENWRAWDFHIDDALGHEIAVVTKSWEGFARTLWSRADRYVVHVNRPLSPTLSKMVVACALSIDVALKQDTRSFG